MFPPVLAMRGVLIPRFALWLKMKQTGQNVMEIASVDMLLKQSCVFMFNPVLKMLKLDDKWEISAFQKNANSNFVN